jgi:hypothetical protein
VLNHSHHRHIIIIGWKIIFSIIKKNWYGRTHPIIQSIFRKKNKLGFKRTV